MEGLDAIVQLANKLSGVGFATLLLVILWGSWKNVWVWSRDVERLTKQYEALLAKAEEQTEWWRSLAIRVTGIAERQGTVANELAKKTGEKR